MPLCLKGEHQRLSQTAERNVQTAEPNGAKRGRTHTQEERRRFRGNSGPPKDCAPTTSTNHPDRDGSQSHLRMDSHSSKGSCQRRHSVLYSLASPVLRGVASKRGPFPLRTAVQRSSDVLSPGFEGWRWRQHATVCSQSARPRIHSAQEQARTKEPP